MEVLKYKKISKFEAKQKCENCKSKLKFNEKDIRIEPSPFNQSFARTVMVDYKIVCPICGAKQELNHRNLKNFDLYIHTHMNTANLGRKIKEAAANRFRRELDAIDGDD